MAPRPRDLLKTRPQRVGEVLSNVHLKAGQANSQVVLWGADVAVGAPTTTFAVTAGEVVIGQAIVAIAAVATSAVPAGAATAVGEFRKVLVEVNAAGVVSTVVGDKAASQAAATIPAGDPTCISVGVLELPASFVPGTTVVTAAMCKDVLYSS